MGHKNVFQSDNVHMNYYTSIQHIQGKQYTIDYLFVPDK